MAVGISLKGIDEAIASLKYRNANTLKSRLVRAVRCLYENEGPIESVEGINAEKLIAFFNEISFTEKDPRQFTAYLRFHRYGR